MEADPLSQLKLGHRTTTTWIGHFDSLFIREHKNRSTEEIKKQHKDRRTQDEFYQQKNIETADVFTNKRTKGHKIDNLYLRDLWKY